MTSHHVTEQIVRGLYKSWWVVTALLLLVGAAVNFDLLTDEDLGPLLNHSDEVAAGDDDQLTAVGDLDAYPVVAYAGLQFALVDVRAIPVNQSGRPIIVVDLAIRNTTDVQARVPINMLRLIGPGGQTAAAERFEYAVHGNRIVVEPGQTALALAVFKLNPGPIGLLSNHTLEVGEQGRWPVAIGLDGAEAESVFPQALPTMDRTGGDGAQSGAEYSAQYQGLNVALVDALTDLEFGPYRAPVGQHLAVITVRVVGPGAVIDRSLWTLGDSTGESRAVRAVVEQRSADGTVTTIKLVFSYSTDSSELELLVGRSNRRESVARFVVRPFE